MTPDIFTLLVMAAALVGAGVLAGLIAGLLGVGGGLVTVPVLFNLFEIMGYGGDRSMHVAIGTSLTTIVATSISSMRAHTSRGAVDWPSLKALAPGVVAGVIAGTIIASAVKGAVLTSIFAVIATIAALHFLISPQSTKLRDGLPGQPWRFGIGGLIGLVASLMGIGGGTISVPTLVACGKPVRTAVGTASAIGLVIAVPGAAGFVWAGWGVEGLPPYSLGYVSLIGFLLLIPTTTLMAPVGARIAHGIDPKLLKRIFAVFLLIVSVRMFWALSG